MSPSQPKIAVFAGSFDPFTLGHEQVVREALRLFDKVIVAVGHSLSKTGFLPVEDRLKALEQTFAKEKRVEVKTFQGLVVDFAKREGATSLVRGLRSSADFDYELPMAHINSRLAHEIQTLFFATAAEKSFISSTLVREVVKNGGDPSPFVPAAFVPVLKGLKK